MSANLSGLPATAPGHGQKATPGVALVTGGGVRVGRAIVEALAGAGHPVCIHYNASAEPAEALAAEIEAAGGRAAAIGADLADAGEAAALVGRAAALIGPIEVLVNNASRFVFDRPGTFDLAGWEAHQAINLRAPALLGQALDGALPEGRQGAIVNLLDQKLFNLNPDFFTYSVAKYGLLGMTYMTAMAYAPRIRVNGVAPGLVLPSARMTPERFAFLHTQTPLGRGATVAEVAAAVLYCVQTSGLTGQVIPVDAGESLAWRAHDIAFVGEAPA